VFTPWLQAQVRVPITCGHAFRQERSVYAAAKALHQTGVYSLTAGSAVRAVVDNLELAPNVSTNRTVVPACS